jgi:hypothetical protein
VRARQTPNLFCTKRRKDSAPPRVSIAHGSTPVPRGTGSPPPTPPPSFNRAWENPGRRAEGFATGLVVRARTSTADFLAGIAEKKRRAVESQQRNVKTRTLQTPKSAAPAGATLREGTLGEFRWNSRKAEWSARRVFIELKARSGAARKGWPPAAERLVTHPPPTPPPFPARGYIYLQRLQYMYV